jgi:hypothetical protein
MCRSPTSRRSAAVGVAPRRPEGLDPRDKLVHREGLRHVVVRAGLQALDALLDLAAGRKDKDARRASRIPEPR